MAEIVNAANVITEANAATTEMAKIARGVVEITIPNLIAKAT
ncbi:hypothetical protein [Wolbachia endosymbiont (group B) of Xanthorhoe designata]